MFTDLLKTSKMETIITNAGLQHLAEKVFWNLDIGGMNICAQINQSCKTNFAKSNILFGILQLSFKENPK